MMTKQKVKLENEKVVEFEYDSLKYSLIRIKNQPLIISNIFFVDASFHLTQTRKMNYDLITTIKNNDKIYRPYFFSDGNKDRNVKAEEIEMIPLDRSLN